MKQIINYIWNMPASQVWSSLGSALIILIVIWLVFMAWIMYKMRH